MSNKKYNGVRFAHRYSKKTKNFPNVLEIFTQDS